MGVAPGLESAQMCQIASDVFAVFYAGLVHSIWCVRAFTARFLFRQPCGVERTSGRVRGILNLTTWPNIPGIS